MNKKKNTKKNKKKNKRKKKKSQAELDQAQDGLIVAPERDLDQA